MAMYLFIGMSLIGACVQHTRPGKDKYYFWGIFWPGVAFLGMSALFTILHDKITKRCTNGDPVDPRDAILFVGGWLTITLMVITSDAHYTLTTGDHITAVGGLLAAAAAFTAAAHWRD